MEHINTSFLNFIQEMEEPENVEGGLGSVVNSLGPKQGKLVISGPKCEKYQEKVLDAVRKVDKHARVDFYPKTGKIVGIAAVSLLKDIQKELRKIDAGLVAEIKK